MPTTTTSPWVRARHEAAEKKRKVAHAVVYATCNLPPNEVIARVGAELQRRGFESSLNTEEIRLMRHAARKDKGLPFDGIANPLARNRHAVRARHTAAVEWAYARLMRGQATTITEVARATGVGFDTARSCLHTAMRRARREREATPGAQLEIATTPPVETRGDVSRVRPFAINGEVAAALELLTQAMEKENLITLSVSKGTEGWGYSCTRRVTEDLTGVL